MKLDIKRIDVWVASVKDKPGTLATKLEALSKAGANLDFVIARRAHNKTKTGVVFASPIRGAKKMAAAKKAGIKRSKSLQGLKITAADKPGLGAKITQQLAQAGINLRGFSGVAIGKKVAMNLAFDSAADVNKAVKQLKKAAPKL